ncbi:TonB-dependent receptor [Granulicella arctica]|uniref:TonB-dependent receptor n=1 Tax=Granulicella arctica TaxID=940613 RepID=UPI0021DF5FE6|nr:TonB-dependent receptor [Granulicella arctica]
MTQRFHDSISPRLRQSLRTLLSSTLCLCLLLLTSSLLAQSTYGVFVGTVKDPQGAIIIGATIKLINTETATVHEEVSNNEGQYTFQNVGPGTYRIEVTFKGFRQTQFPGLVLQSRETQRVDATMALGAENQTIEVQTAAAVINTDTSNLTETRSGIELNNLPIAISSRASGSTSPYATLQTQAGVQSDESGQISVAGQKPSLLSITVDGISTMNVRTSGANSELFPSFNTIEEIRVSQNANAAEFGGIADITTVSKGGTNRGHGGLFDNYATKGFNSNLPFGAKKPNLVLNNFGLFYSGPVIAPFLYNGRDKTFYFLSYEGLRLPQTSTVTNSVPTAAMRGGDLSVYPTKIFNPAGVAFANNIIPTGQINATSAAMLARYYPLPNAGAAGAITNNYIQNFNTSIGSDQGDGRIDHIFTPKQSAFVRYGFKQRSTATALGLLTGIQSIPSKNINLTGSYNYGITPTLFNEFRAGLSKFIQSSSFNSNSSVISTLGIQGITDLLDPSIAALPRIAITGFTTVTGSSAVSSSNTYQFIDNLTWTRGRHTLKGGGDFRRLYAHASNVFGSSRLGQYSFTGSSAPGKVIAKPFASFLQGIPDSTTLSDVLAPDLNGRGNAYAVYLQDDWKLTNNLTLNFGLRYEYHPVLTDKFQNSANFLPDYYSNINGTTVHGAVVVPGTYALANNVLPAFIKQIAPLPLLTAAQAGISDGLVSVSKNDFAPRFGFAWRPLGNDKTVIRGGLGRFIATALGGSVVGGWAVSASTVNIYSNTYASAGVPQLKFPTPFATAPGAAGALDFDYGVAPHYKDPTVQQWNLTVEQDLGYQTGLRVSYSGSHGQDLVEQANINQVPYGTLPAGQTAPAQSSFPYPALGEIQANENLAVSNYNALSVEATHRMTHGLQFQGSYTFARNLSDEGGLAPTAEVGESGALPSDYYHPLVDYGNVEFTHRQRFLGSGVYDLPFGHNRAYLGNLNSAIDKVIGNWQFSGFYLHQTGPFMTPINSGSDPTGTGLIALGYAAATRPDVVAGVSPYLSGGGARHTLNPAAFTSPANNIGRQGNAAVGSVVGPGTDSFSTSLLKGITFTERIRVDMGVQVQNLFNHHNYETTALDINVPSSYGISTTVQGQAAGQQANAGPRALLLTGRVSF